MSINILLNKLLFPRHFLRQHSFLRPLLHPISAHSNNSETEYNLLKLFIEHRGKIVTQQMLLTHILGSDHNKQPHYLHVYIGSLRRKIEPDATHPRFLQTISRVGYRFQDDDED